MTKTLGVLPCGGFGELDPKGKTMQMVCIRHVEWERDARGELIVDVYPVERGEPDRVFRQRRLPSCGAITDLDHAGCRVVVGYVHQEAEAAE